MRRTLLFVLLFCTAAMLCGTFKDAFKAGLDQAETKEQRLEVIQDFASKAAEIEDHGVLQDNWMEVDREDCLRYYDQLLKMHPNDPKYQYLVARLKDNALRMTDSRQIIAQFPDSYWGYCSLAESMYDLLSDEATAADYADKEYPADKSLLQQGLQKYPSDSHLNLAQFRSHWFDSDLQAAEQSLLAIKDDNIPWNKWGNILDFLREADRAELLEPLQRRLKSEWARPDNYEQLSEEERQEYDKRDSETGFNRYYVYNLCLLGEPERIENVLDSHSEYQNDSQMQLHLVYAYLIREQTDTSLNLIQNLVETGVLDYLNLKNDEILADLQGDQRWEGILAAAEQKWQAEVLQHRQEVLQNRQDKPSPDWELEDAAGNKVRLADLRGKVVILDFWATWCGPCRNVMPVLDNWMKTSMPEGVKVFSINVMEKDPQKARDYMKEKIYAMTLLLNGDKVYNQYGGSNIPQIIVIDKQGKIAYEHVGFSTDLEFKLQTWAEALVAE